MATIDTLIDDLQAWTSVGSTRLSDAVAGECLNTAMRKLQRIYPWVRSMSVRLTVGAGVGYVPLPPGFVTEKAVALVDTAQTDPSKALTPIDRTTRVAWLQGRTADTSEQVYPRYAGSESDDEITQYYVYDGNLVVVPTPSSEITLDVEYEPQTMDLVVDSGMENLLTRDYADIVREGGLAEAYAYLHEPDKSLFHTQRFNQAAKEGITQREAASLSGSRPYTRGT